MCCLGLWSLLGVGSGAGGLECCAIIGLWPCIPKPPFFVREMMSQIKMKATWSVKEDERERQTKV